MYKSHLSDIHCVILFVTSGLPVWNFILPNRRECKSSNSKHQSEKMNTI